MLRCMRTTLALEDDVAAQLQRLQKRRGLKLKDAVNQALRIGLTRIDSEATPAKPYQTPSMDLGRCLLANIDDIAEALALAEGEDHR